MQQFQYVEVSLNDVFVGVLVEDENGRIFFEYDKSFIEKGLEISPFKLPLSKGTYEFAELRRKSFRGLPGVYSDSLPDHYGSKVIQEYFRKKGIAPDDIPLFARLLYIGKRGMGALEYSPEEKLEIREGADIELAELWYKSRSVLEGKIKDQTDGIFRYGGSAGGARAKAIILYDPSDKTFKTPGGDETGRHQPWIIKFDGVLPENPKLDHPLAWERIEFIYNLMAQDAGLDISEFDYVEERGRFHFLVKRFDRRPPVVKSSGGARGLRKIHTHTLGGLMHCDHNDQRALSYEIYLRRILDLTNDNRQVRQGYRRMVFNALAQNYDDHVKNFSFLMDQSGGWRISPAYDLVFTDTRHPWFARGHQMTVNGKSIDLAEEDLHEVARNFGIKKPGQIIEEVIEALSRFDEFSKRYELKKLFPDYHKSALDAIDERRKKLRGPSFA